MDEEFFLLFSVMDENMSWYLDENIEMFGSNKTDVEDEDFQESNKMHGNVCLECVIHLSYLLYCVRFFLTL